MKICERCNRTHSDTYIKYCKPCYTRVWKDKNPEKKRQHQNAYAQKTNFFHNKRWCSVNKEAIAQRDKRRAQRLAAATPQWVDKKVIDDFYKNRPNGYEVDHIYPIYNQMLCGLHVPWNLRYVKPEENKKKGCKVIY